MGGDSLAEVLGLFGECVCLVNARLDGVVIGYWSVPVIIAGEFGPVIPEIYQKYKIYGRGGIPKQENRKVLQLDCEKMRIIKKEVTEISRGDKRLIEKVVDTYAEITEPIVLAKKTCEEDPWKNTSLNKEIKNSLIRKSYLVVKKNGRN